MLREIKLWSEKLKDGSQIAHNFHFEHSGALPKNITKIVFFGMGGSGIAGRIVKTFFDKKSEIPTFVVDGPDVPRYVDGQTLAIVVSYSGNTWETVSAFNTLVSKHIPTIVFSNKGRLLEIAEEKNILFMMVPNSATPRSALGSFLGMILGLFGLMGLIHGKEILEAFQKYLEVYLPKLEDETYYRDFIALAKDGDDFYIWGVSGDSAAFAYRAQTQFNENSKSLAVFSSFPECCHNLLVGLTNPKAPPLVLLLSTEFVSPELEIALESVSSVLKEQKVPLYKPPVLGDNWEEQLFHIVLWADFASYYLAIARGQDVEPVVLIDKLKETHKNKSKRIR